MADITNGVRIIPEDDQSVGRLNLHSADCARS